MEENKECLECGAKDHLFELKSGCFVCKDCMNKLGEKVKDLLDKEKNLEILGPVPCIITKIKENYRWQIMIKGNFNEEIPKKIKYILYELTKSVYNEIRVSMDINPKNMA